MYADIKILISTIRETKNYGKHDGLGNPVIDVPLYQEWALKTVDQIEEIVTSLEDLEDLSN